MGTVFSHDSTPLVSGGVLGGLLFGVGIGYSYAWREFKKRQQQIEDTVARMKFVGNITAIFIFPVKSCRPIVVTDALCTALGLASGEVRDRNFMVTDEKYHFISARQEGKLVTIQPSYHDDELWLDVPGMNTLKMKIPDAKSDARTVRIFGQNSRGIDCGEEVAEWLQKALQRPANKTRLVYHPWDTMERIPDDWQKWDRFQRKDTCVYADLCGFNILNQASLDELNGRLSKKVTALNFRPNFVVNGKQSFEEDSWKYVKIGNTSLFRVVRPCTRCVLTTIDPETGVRSAKGDPLTTLKSYRQVTDPVQRKLEGESPMFGVYLGVDIGGHIRIGDPIFAAD